MAYEMIKMENGETIYLETKSTVTPMEGPIQASLHDAIVKSTLSLTNEATKIGRFLNELREGIMAELHGQQPSQIELEVGLGFDQNIGCVFVGSTLNAQVGLKLIWEKENGNT